MSEKQFERNLRDSMVEAQLAVTQLDRSLPEGQAKDDPQEFLTGYSVDELADYAKSKAQNSQDNLEAGYRLLRGSGLDYWDAGYAWSLLQARLKQAHDRTFGSRIKAAGIARSTVYDQMKVSKVMSRAKAKGKTIQEVRYLADLEPDKQTKSLLLEAARSSERKHQAQKEAFARNGKARKKTSPTAQMAAQCNGDEVAEDRLNTDDVAEDTVILPDDAGQDGPSDVDAAHVELLNITTRLDGVADLLTGKELSEADRSLLSDRLEEVAEALEEVRKVVAAPEEVNHVVAAN